MRKVHLVSVLMLIVLGATGCGPLKISPAAIDDFKNATRLTLPDTVEVSDSQVSRLAAQASVDDDVIRNVAPDLEAQTTWKSSTTKLRELFDLVPAEVRQKTISIACDVIQSEDQTTEAIAQALFDEFGAVEQTQIEQIVTSFLDYYNDMNAALAAGDDSAAAVVLTCYLAEQAS